MDKSIRIELKNRGRFLRNFQREADRNYYLTRMGFGKKGSYMGRLTKSGVKLYRAKVGIFSLFALTATGTLERENGQELLRVRFGRSLVLTLLWGSWCAFMILAGLLLLGTEILFSLVFLVPGLGLLLPLFLFSKKEKQRLLKFLEDLALPE